jgi:hypothetical protein
MRIDKRRSILAALHRLSTFWPLFVFNLGALVEFFLVYNAFCLSLLWIHFLICINDEFRIKTLELDFDYGDIFFALGGANALGAGKNAEGNGRNQVEKN